MQAFQTQTLFGRPKEAKKRKFLSLTIFSPRRFAARILDWRPSSRHRSPGFLRLAISAAFLRKTPRNRVRNLSAVHSPANAAVAEILEGRKLSPCPVVMQRPMPLAIRLVHHDRCR